MRRFVVLACLGLLVLLCEAFVQTPDGTGHPTWGLRRIWRHPLSPLAENYQYVATGKGVNIYIVGGGVRCDHADFQTTDSAFDFCTGSTTVRSRVTYIGDFCTGSLRRGSREYALGTPNDGYDGHDTHVASYAAGTLSGVAKGAHIYSLRTAWDDNDLANGGTYCGPGSPAPDGSSAIAAAFRWITRYGRTYPDGVWRPGVVNYSAGGGSSGVRDAILDTINAGGADQGFLVTLSGGTGGLVTDSIYHWGNQVPYKALVVGGTDINDNALNRAPNFYGSALGLYAPAAGLIGAGISGFYNIPVVPGDSYAAPFVAGAAALYLQLHPRALPSQVRQVLINRASKDVVHQPSGEDLSINRLLYALENVRGDFDDDGISNISIFRPSTGAWHVRGLYERVMSHQ